MASDIRQALQALRQEFDKAEGLRLAGNYFELAKVLSKICDDSFHAHGLAQRASRAKARRESA